MKPTRLVLAALIGGSLFAAAPAFAGPGNWHRGDRYQHHDRYHSRVVAVQRPVVVYHEPARIYYAPRPAPAYVSYGYASPAGAGTVAGALAGAVIGSQLGHGPDRVAGAAFGSVLGALIGSQLDAGRY